ncbi:MAG TPA: hypothetical protein VGM90_40860 [Kofleriaceae bacterium]
MSDDKKPRDPFAPLPLSDELQKAGEKSGPLPKAAKRAVDAFAPLALPKEPSGAAPIKPPKPADSGATRKPATTEPPRTASVETAKPASDTQRAEPVARPTPPTEAARTASSVEAPVAPSAPSPVEAARVRAPSVAPITVPIEPPIAPSSQPRARAASESPALTRVASTETPAESPSVADVATETTADALRAANLINPSPTAGRPGSFRASTSPVVPTRARSEPTIDLDDDEAVRAASTSASETAPSESAAFRVAPTSTDLVKVEKSGDAMADVDDFLKDAVGKRKKRASDDDDGGGRKRSRGGAIFAALTIVAGAGIAGLVLLGRVNHSRYIIKCTAEQVSVERGRSFPPWGTAPVTGAEWAPVKLPPEAACTPRETEDLPELSGWFAKLLEDQATALLTAREVSKVDEAEADLKQALLVSRGLATEDVRIDTRERIERLLGDVSYWRASAKLKLAAEALGEAAKEYEAAAQQKPRYVTDASAWALYLRKVTDDLKLGPAGAKTSAFGPVPTSDKAPLGSELPIEPAEAGSGSATPSEPTAPSTAGSAAPTGGVLL